MSGISTIPAFKAALVARLQADAAFGGVPVTYGLKFPLEKEVVLVWGVRAAAPTSGEGGQRAAAIGRGRSRDERYVQEVIVSISRSAREPQQTLTERAFALASAIEASLLAWATETPKFGATGVWDAYATAMDLAEPADKDAREARVAVDIAVKARLT